MRAVLTTYYGFASRDIATLTDYAATTKAMRDAIAKFVKGATRGDTLLFHYSGHGANVPDKDGDEADRRDEILCPTDLDWKDPLLDDWLRTTLDKLPAGVNLTVVMDCCHSGSNTRAILPPDAPVIPRYLPNPGMGFDWFWFLSVWQTGPAGQRVSRGNPEWWKEFEETLPHLRVQANYFGDGAGGSRLIREGGFPGTVVGSVDTSFGSVLGQVFTGDFPGWTFGVTFSYPLGNSTAEANLARARLERDQAAARLRSNEVTAVRQVRQAALRLEQNRQRIETTRLTRELAQQRLDAEQRRFDVGMSTSFLVIQAQRDLAIACNGELQALLDYQLAAIAFEVSQQTSTTRFVQQ